MESISLLPSVSIPKLPSNGRASFLRFDLRNKTPAFSRLSNGPTDIVSIGSISNLNTCNRLLARCGNVYGGETHSDAIDQDPLKSLLSLVQPKENSTITRFKREALKLVVEGKHTEAGSHMEQLFKGDADLANEARVAHVQILIHLDEYEKVLQFLEKDGNFPQSKLWERRLCLYKAVVHTMLEKDGNNAEKWWNKYLETLGNSNVNKKLEINCRNNKNSEMNVIRAKDILKPLLSLKPAEKEGNSLVSNIIHTKNIALKEVMNGEYDLAENLMKCKADLNKDSQEGLVVQIAYVHILLYLDKYEEALNHLNKIQCDYFSPSDLRPCLYKAIGLTMLGNHEDAKICWKAFMQTIHTKGLPNPPNEN